MKSSILIFFFVITSSATCFSQLKRDPGSNKIKYSEILKLSDLSKEQIYSKAKLWIVSTLKSGDNMVELTGNSSDQIVGTGNMLLDSVKLTMKGKAYSKDAHLNFKFIVLVKEGRLKYSVENFSIPFKDAIGAGYVESGIDQIKKPYSVPAGKMNEYQQIMEVYLDRKIRQVISNFESAMRTTPDEDW